MGDFQGLVHSIIAHAWCHFEVPHGPICRIRSHYAILKVAGDMPNWSSGEATQALDSDLVPRSTGASTQPTWVDYIYTLLIGRMYSEANGSVRIVGIELDAIHCFITLLDGLMAAPIALLRMCACMSSVICPRRRRRGLHVASLREDAVVGPEIVRDGKAWSKRFLL